MPLENETSSVFDLTRIQRDAAVGHIKFRRELPSTNDCALQWAHEAPLESPVLVLTEVQTAGRGRGTNRWWSGPGALTFSLLTPMPSGSLPAAHRPKVSLTAGLAVCEALRELYRKQEVRSDSLQRVGRPAEAGYYEPPRIGLKWPNDVLLDERKVCGILVEASSARPDCVVIGIGLNVNNSLAGAPPELQSTATALVDRAQIPFDLTEVLIEVLQQLTAGLQMLTTNDEALFDCWQHYCVLQGRRISLDLGTNRVSGLCRGIDPDGALVLETDRGPQRFVSGVVSRFE